MESLLSYHLLPLQMGLLLADIVSYADHDPYDICTQRTSGSIGADLIVVNIRRIRHALAFIEEQVHCRMLTNG